MVWRFLSLIFFQDQRNLFIGLKKKFPRNWFLWKHEEKIKFQREILEKNFNRFKKICPVIGVSINCLYAFWNAFYEDFCLYAFWNAFYEDLIWYKFCRWKKFCPLIGCVRLLECPLIRELTVSLYIKKSLQKKTLIHWCVICYFVLLKFHNHLNIEKFCNSYNFLNVQNVTVTWFITFLMYRTSQ